jgi:hypothetical protein
LLGSWLPPLPELKLIKTFQANKGLLSRGRKQTLLDRRDTYSRGKVPNQHRDNAYDQGNDYFASHAMLILKTAEIRTKKRAGMTGAPGKRNVTPL